MKISKKVQIGALADDSINYRLLCVSPLNKTYHFMISTSVAFANGKYVLRVYHFDFPSSFSYEKIMDQSRLPLSKKHLNLMDTALLCDSTAKY